MNYETALVTFTLATGLVFGVWFLWESWMTRRTKGPEVLPPPDRSCVRDCFGEDIQ